MKKVVIFIAIFFSGFAIFTLCSTNKDYQKDASDLYQGLIELNDNFTKKAEDITNRNDASLVIDKFISEQQRLFDKLGELEKKYPDFRKDPALRDFETTLEIATRKTASTFTGVVKSNLPIAGVKKIIDKTNHMVRLITDKYEKTE